MNIYTITMIIVLIGAVAGLICGWIMLKDWQKTWCEHQSKKRLQRPITPPKPPSQEEVDNRCQYCRRWMTAEELERRKREVFNDPVDW